MKTEQEQVEEIVKILLEASKKCLDTDCDCCVDQYKKECAQYRKAVALVRAGYGDVSEYKAEIERLRQEVRDTDKMARNTIEQYRAKNKELENALKQSEDNYSRAFERLKAQQREIERLKAENDTNAQYIRMMGIQSHVKTSNERVKQGKIDILNYLKDGYEVDISTSNDCDMVVRVDDIDELIKEVQNDSPRI